jgi:hypothetical protein
MKQQQRKRRMWPATPSRRGPSRDRGRVRVQTPSGRVRRRQFGCRVGRLRAHEKSRMSGVATRMPALLARMCTMSAASHPREWSTAATALRRLVSDDPQLAGASLACAVAGGDVALAAWLLRVSPTPLDVSSTVSAQLDAVVQRDDGEMVDLLLEHGLADGDNVNDHDHDEHDEHDNDNGSAVALLVAAIECDAARVVRSKLRCIGATKSGEEGGRPRCGVA